MPTVSVIIVNYNVRPLLEQCLLSLREACKRIDAEIFVVDNHSTDDSVQYIREHFPEVIPIESARNIGFAAANNLALRHAAGRYFWLLNPDTLVQADTLEVLVDFFEGTPDCGIAGCKVLNDNGTLQLSCRRGFPSPLVALGKLIGLSRLVPKSRLWGRYNLTYLDATETHPVDAVSGACLMIRRETFERIGYMDENFFMYGEDLDWCYRAQKTGWNIYYHPATAIIHYKGASSDQDPGRAAREFYRAMSVFVNKHMRDRYVWYPVWLLQGGIAIRYGFSAAGSRLRQLLLPAMDLLWINCAILGAIVLRFGELRPLPVYYDWRSYLIICGIPSLIYLTAFTVNGFYSYRSLSKFGIMLGVGTGMIGISALTFFFNAWAFSRLVVLYSGGLLTLFLIIWRFGLQWIYRLWKWKLPVDPGTSLYPRRSAVLGIDEESRRNFRLMSLSKDQPFEPIGYIQLKSAADIPEGVDRSQILGTMADFETVVRTHRIHEIIFSTKSVTHETIIGLIQQYNHLNVHFTLIPNMMESIIGTVSARQVGDVPYVDVDYAYYSRKGRTLKRIFDIAAALTFGMPGALLLLPLLLARVYSVRTIPVTTKDNMALKIPVLVRKGKPAVTWFQMVPALCQVLVGSLSLVGTPVQRRSKSTTSPLLLNYKAGIFSPVPVLPFTQNHMIEREMYYLKNYSPALDLMILWQHFSRGSLPVYMHHPLEAVND